MRSAGKFESGCKKGVDIRKDGQALDTIAMFADQTGQFQLRVHGNSPDMLVAGNLAIADDDDPLLFHQTAPAFA